MAMAAMDDDQAAVAEGDCALDDDALDTGLLAQQALCRLLATHRAGAFANEAAVEFGSVEACEQAWLVSGQLPDNMCAAALQVSQQVWKDGVPTAVMQSAAWRQAADVAARATAGEGEGEAEAGAHPL